MLHNDTSGHWFAIQTKPRYEYISSAIILQKGITTLLPTYEESRQWSDRTKRLKRPAFPGYFFCKANEGQLAQVALTTGVRRVVGCGGRPEPIEESEIEALRAAVEAGLAVRPHSYVEIGDRISLDSGPLAGTQGVVVADRNGCKFVVSVEILRRSVAVDVPPHWLKRLQ
jgi:transcription antitermination factor NusG